MATTKPQTWHRIALTRHEYESGEIGVLFGSFRAAFIAKNGPAGMAMFGHWTEDGERYFVYLSPAAGRYIVPLLMAYSAHPTGAPDPAGLTLLYGDETSRSAFMAGFEA
ncbi:MULTISPECIES: hypothetical protein [Methylomonas]|uniref:Uncharacterized protein n=1 Tax=Methylomonas koyamae TaxID=702114 RepID=A0A177NCC3_9GAMM|nr:hypothetical protein [Methylomonas koyamae]NJA04378.1 hypothetical protein [Methylococcaceae bacterium WWC4]OAI15093.1 hypothetical protein A1355_11360 [Methylomonas koyamae]